ncbi:hypothetical protein GLAREA_05768 [Glarea lozoyensis ATCC 20868]|uniref:Uncharacterized protein n=1 Tax=Glarea lozoyensis (strain ATCC 20868 / MF5171) TaxID=1116229 RepID=S3DF92_GLAL2|nr:uncharacterized protein GLAREA_05768 [Glarea lozoyensis ATCC 20868]EPE36430.1 hypothetical protein GLAREA_05768 [Glarea lozoyensis ATCC 20868]
MRLAIIISIFSLSTLSLSAVFAQSSQFALVVLSDSKTYNGTTLIPCQKGKQGPYPGLCPLAQLRYPISDLEAAFNLNNTSSQTRNTGFLTYELKNRQTSNGIADVKAPMAFNNKGSYQVPVFGYASFDTASKVSFNEKNYLGTMEGSSHRMEFWVSDAAAFFLRESEYFEGILVSLSVKVVFTKISGFFYVVGKVIFKHHEFTQNARL